LLETVDSQLQASRPPEETLPGWRSSSRGKRKFKWTHILANVLELHKQA